MQAVILAGGLGHRLRPFTEVIPKPLLPLGEKTIMEIQISCLGKYGITKVFVATNYMSDLVEAYLGDGRRFGVDVRISKEHKPLGTCGPIGLLRDELTEPFLVINGDILTKLDFRAFYDFAARRDSWLTVATKIVTTPFRFGTVIVDENDQILRVQEKPEFSLEILAGVYFMRCEIFSLIPRDAYFGMDSLITQMLEDRRAVSRYLVQDYWLDIGQVEDYSKARQGYEEHFEPEGLRSVVGK